LKIFPLVVLTVLDSKCFTFTVRENKLHQDHLVFEVNAPIVAKCQWQIKSRSSSKPPEVNDLEVIFKEFGNFGGRKIDPGDT